jgi:hypothetical protein
MQPISFRLIILYPQPKLISRNKSSIIYNFYIYLMIILIKNIKAAKVIKPSNIESNNIFQVTMSLTK